MWNFMKRAKVTFIIGGVILLIAAGGIIYAVATGEGDEGFIAQWHKQDMPLTCTYKNDEVLGKHMGVMTDAILGMIDGDDPVSHPYVSSCQPWLIKNAFPSRPPEGGILLRVGIPPEKVEDGVTVTTPFDAKHGGSTILYHRADGSVGGAVIWIAPDLPKNLELAVWTHEFGHALGLAHDRTKDSVMYPVASERTAKLSTRDFKRLREAYYE